MSIYGPPRPAWRPPQDAAGFCKGHIPDRPSYKYWAPPRHGPPLPAHIQEERAEASRQRLIDALAARGYRLTFENM